MHEHDEDFPSHEVFSQEPPLKIDFAVISATSRPMLRRRTTLLTIGTAVLAAGVITASAMTFSDRSAAPAAPAPGTSSITSTDVTGKWILTAIDVAGRATVTKAQLEKSGFTVQIEFDTSGAFLMNNGGCGTTTGKYTVSSGSLSLKDPTTMAGNCGYSSTEIETFANTLAREINKIPEADSISIRRNVDQLIITAGMDQYVYQRAH